jgi:hypothetical protein
MNQRLEVRGKSTLLTLQQVLQKRQIIDFPNIIWMFGGPVLSSYTRKREGIELRGRKDSTSVNGCRYNMQDLTLQQCPEEIE